MARSLWRGAISFGLVYIPVNLFSADVSHALDLTMLDKRDFSPIGYKRINKTTQKEVEMENIVKGLEFEPDEYVVLSEEDLKRANVEATQTIDILSFVETQQIPPIYFERPYYLAPSKGGEKVYSLLYMALERSQKAAIAQVVMHTKQHLVALVPVNGIIVLNTLRYADEIRPTDVAIPTKTNAKRSDVTEKEIEMATSLVDGMTENWNPTQYHDTYREDVMAMVHKKIEQKQTKTITEPTRGEPPIKSAEIIDLMALLRKSIEEKTKRAAKHDLVKEPVSKHLKTSKQLERKSQKAG